MAHETVFLVQAFRAGKGKRLIADTPVKCRTAEIARQKAERLADTMAGVVAFAMSGDAELGEYDDAPAILFKSGRLPPQFEES